MGGQGVRGTVAALDEVRFVPPAGLIKLVQPVLEGDGWPSHGGGWRQWFEPGFELPPDRGRDPPAAGDRFDGGAWVAARAPRPQVTDFGARRPAFSLQPPVDDQPASDTGPHRHIEHAPVSLSRPVVGLGQGGRIAIVAEHGRPAQPALAPGPQRECVPAGDLVALGHDPAAAVHRAAKAHADGANIEPFHEVGADPLDLSENPLRAVARIDRAPLKGLQRAAPPIAHT
ncbi:MAG: hypothetical protein A2W31_01245 [Planctomycetes bacterium RBG_16_64_10]|nr:MAG: hypothetical protein A2W31_01245 [Planctomycetes bacterium RBG_16_64_10]